MMLRTLLSGLICLGYVACAGAETESTEAVAALTIADVQAAPDAWRTVDPENMVIMDTSRGKIIIELLPEVAPAHADQFRAYVRAGLYNGTAFHRVIKGFMAQGGDVEATHGADVMMEQMDGEFTFRRDPKVFAIDPVGPADSATRGLHNGFPIETVAQFMSEMSFDGQVETWMPHCKGVLSTARTTDPNSANAQFFLITDKGRHLDKEYTAKGRILSGMDAATKIKLGPSPDGAPIFNPDILRTVVMAADMPAAEQPKVYVQRTNSPEWTAVLIAADKSKTDVCDLPEIPVVIE